MSLISHSSFSIYIILCFLYFYQKVISLLKAVHVLCQVVCWIKVCGLFWTNNIFLVGWNFWVVNPFYLYFSIQVCNKTPWKIPPSFPIHWSSFNFLKYNQCWLMFLYAGMPICVISLLYWHHFQGLKKKKKKELSCYLFDSYRTSDKYFVGLSKFQ